MALLFRKRLWTSRAFCFAIFQAVMGGAVIAACTDAPLALPNSGAGGGNVIQSPEGGEPDASKDGVAEADAQGTNDAQGAIDHENPGDGSNDAADGSDDVVDGSNDATDGSDAADASDDGADESDGADGSNDAEGGQPGDGSDGIVHALMPTLQKHPGPFLVSPEFTAVTYDEYDQQGEIDDFVSSIGATGATYWGATVSEYGVGPAIAKTPVHISAPAPTAIDDLTLLGWLDSMLDGTHPEFGTPNENSLYVIFYPSTTKVTNSGLVGCQDFGGYHATAYLSRGPWANTVVPYAVIPECDAGGGPLFTTTVAATHELSESSTDPDVLTGIPGPGWQGFDADHRIWDVLLGGGGGENADVCQPLYGTDIFPLGYSFGVARTWSNAAAKAGHDPCVPPLPGETYFNAAAVMNDAVTLRANGQNVTTLGVLIPLGQTKEIEVDLHSDNPMAPWSVSATDFSALLGGGPSLSFVWDATTGQDGTKLHLLITALQGTSKYGGEPFTIKSSNGGPHHEWFGYVAQN